MGPALPFSGAIQILEMEPKEIQHILPMTDPWDERYIYPLEWLIFMGSIVCFSAIFLLKTF